MKILVIGDLHGRKSRIHFNDYDCIIQVGDVCDDREFRPYIKKWFSALKNDRVNTPSVDEFIIRAIGKKGMKKLEENSVKVGRRILEYLNSFGKPIFIVPGNWDQSYGKTKIKNPDKDDYSYIKYFYDSWIGERMNIKLTHGLKNIRDCQFKSHEFSNINFYGYGLSSGYEYYKKKRKLNLSKKEKELLKKDYFSLVKKLFVSYSKRNKTVPTIFISHNIPYETKLDTVKNKSSYAHGKHLGSYVARKFCEKYKPLMCIGGHIHESPGKDKIGKTLLINPGYGVDAQVLIDINEDKGNVRSVKFYGKSKSHKH
jgi:Icc-related predicted phosphoesterase